MDLALPDEFPFKRRTKAQSQAPAPVIAPVEAAVAPPVQSEVPAAPAPATAAASDAPVRRIEAESLVEVASSGRVVYRGAERRRSPRQALRAKAVYRDGSKPAASGPVQILNISMFGVRIWSQRPVTAGSKGSVRMELGPVKWSSKVRVVTCAALEDDGHLIGCEFVVNEITKRRVDAA